MEINLFEILKTFIKSFGNLWLFVIALIIIAFVLFVIFGQKPKAKYQYKLKSSIMTSSEFDFFKMLMSAVGDRYNVFPQIHLDAILNNKVYGQSWFGAFRHINEKSVDFLLCDKINAKPLLAIELDDRSHEREDRRGRDQEVERILRDVNLPLLRIKDNKNLTKEELLRILSGILPA